jgi:hypothetical protein
MQSSRLLKRNICTALMTVPMAVPLFAGHPQTVWTATGLSNLQAVRTTTHATLADHLNKYLDANGGSVTGPYVGGYAMITRIYEPTYVQRGRTAAGSLHCDMEYGS